MGIVDEDVERVRQSTDFVAVASQFIQLKKVGARWTGLCPFHGEKTPSFSVNAEQGLFYCFGCQAKGDAITFVRDIEHLDFVGAVEYLAAKSGISLRYTERNQTESRKRKAQLTEALEAAVAWYHERLLTAADAGAARRYLRDRGFDGAEVRRYRLGWAPDEWDALARALKLPDKVLADSGLGFVNRRNRQQDFFRGRVLFPIFDPQGSPVSFGGRVLPGGEGPKYRNTAETRLYAKSKVLYGLNWSKDDAVRRDEVVICEGYTDVIGFASAGVQRAVATCGTALTEDHVRLLRRFAKRMVLAFDPDAAGQAAAERFYAWEDKYDVDVAVADLPPGQDPGDLARSNPERLAASIDKAVPFLGFRVQRVLGAAVLTSPEGRGRAAESALALVAEHPSELVRDQYLVEVADRCRVDADRLRQSLRRGGKRPRVEVASAVRPRAERDTPESEALKLAVLRPDETLPLLDDVLFVDEANLAAFRVLRGAGGDLHTAMAAADPVAAELLARIAVQDTAAEPADVRRLLLREKTLTALAEVQDEARHSLDGLAYAPLFGWLKLRLEALQADAPQPAAEGELLGWLVARAEGAP